MLHWIKELLLELEDLFTVKRDSIIIDHTMPKNTPSDAQNQPVEPITPPVAPTISNPDVLVPWDSQKHNYHNVRVLCDLAGLTVEQKNVLCACVFQESRFLVNPKPNTNKDPKTGLVWSTDYGIVQVNDYFNIGIGKEFPSVQYVLENPDKCIQWMIDIYKTTGKLQPWASYTTEAYQKWLSPNSPMWLLKS